MAFRKFSDFVQTPQIRNQTETSIHKFPIFFAFYEQMSLLNLASRTLKTGVLRAVTSPGRRQKAMGERQSHTTRLNSWNCTGTLASGRRESPSLPRKSNSLGTDFFTEGALASKRDRNMSSESKLWTKGGPHCPRLSLSPWLPKLDTVSSKTCKSAVVWKTF